MWMTIILAVVAVAVIGVLLRFVFKVGIVLLLVGLIIFFMSGYSVRDLINFGKDKAEKTITQSVVNGIKSAQITDKGNGKYEIKSNSFTADADLNTNLVTVDFNGIKKTFSLNDTGVGQQIRDLINSHLQKIN